jgi:hypothetical protein
MRARFGASHVMSKVVTAGDAPAVGTVLRRTPVLWQAGQVSFAAVPLPDSRGQIRELFGFLPRRVPLIWLA